MSKVIDPKIEENLKLFYQASAEMAAKFAPVKDVKKDSTSKKQKQNRSKTKSKYSNQQIIDRLRKALTFKKKPKDGQDSKKQVQDSKTPVKYWQKKISPEHLGLIHQWIADNRQTIDHDILQSVELAAFYKYNLKKKLYLSFEIVATKERVYIFFMSKSNLANFGNIERLKEKPLTEEELKAGKTKSKEIARGSFKIVQYCLYWVPGMQEPETFTCAVVKGERAINSLGPELKFGPMIGEPFANVGIKGATRLKNGVLVTNLYSRLALGDQFNWAMEGKNMTPPAQMNPSHFMLILYTQALGLEHLLNNGIIWRDLKIENYLMVLTAIQIVQQTNKNKKNIEVQLLLPKMIDFGLSKLTGDIKQLRNIGGSLPYVSPWHDFYLKLREARINLLTTFDRLQTLEESAKSLGSSHPQLEIIRAEYLFCENQYQIYLTEFESIEKIILQRNAPCREAIQAIKNYSLIDLYSPESSTQFLLSPRDDAWAFSKLMTQYIHLAWIRNSNSMKDLALGALYKYFYENVHSSWKTIPNGAQIVQKMEEIFKKYFPDSNSELQLLIQGVKKYFAESQPKSQKQTAELQDDEKNSTTLLGWISKSTFIQLPVREASNPTQTIG